MLSAIDSFVKYLNTELAGTPPVKWIRRTANREDSHQFQEDALNVYVIDVFLDGSEEKMLMSLDILGSDERTVFGWATAVRDVLESTQYTPEFDYATTPGTPIALNRMVSWDRDDLSFDIVRRSERIVHLNATFQICHVRF